MATRAIMHSLQTIELGAQPDETIWCVLWLFSDPEGGIGDSALVKAVILDSDTVAQINGKLVDACVAAAAEKGYTVARTGTIVIGYSRGS